jgi:AcrR family transcriptional regulator
LLLDAAREVIAERGLHATTLRDVAAAGDVAVGTVTYHFAGIEELLAGVLEAEMADWSDPVYRRVADAPTGADGIGELIDGLLASGPRATAHWQLWLDFWALAARREGYADWQARVYRDLHALTARALARGAQDGSLRDSDDRAAVELIALMDGLVVQAYLPGTALTPAAARRILHGWVTATVGR